ASPPPPARRRSATRSRFAGARSSATSLTSRRSAPPAPPPTRSAPSAAPRRGYGRCRNTIHEETMAEKIPMTPTGYRALKEELKRFKEVERPANVKAIEEARGHGDLSENADYSAAKERQSFIEGRIRDLEAKIAFADVIDPNKLPGDKVVFAATVTVEDADSGDRQTYCIVGEDEADIKSGLISVTAPVARAMIGREVGDTVRAKTPKGMRELEIVEVRFVARE